MVLRGDEYAAVVVIFDRMIRTVVAELHLQRLCADGEAHDLLAEADTESWNLARNEFARRSDRVVARRGIARTVRQEHAIGLERKYVSRGSLCRHHRHLAAAIYQHAQDVALDAEVVGDDAILTCCSREGRAIEVVTAGVEAIAL